MAARKLPAASKPLPAVKKRARKVTAAPKRKPASRPQARQIRSSPVINTRSTVRTDRLVNGGIARITASSASSSSTSLPAQEDRAVLFVRQPSNALCDRIDRALSQRLYLLQMQKHEGGPGAEFKVLGSTGNVYSVDIGTRPCCDCPDFLKGRGLCKHILFIWLRVLGVSEDDYRIWQRALISSELSTAVEPLFKRHAKRALPLARKEDQKAFLKATQQEGPEDEDEERRHRKDLGDDCPVCFEAMAEDEETAGKLVFCCACGNNFHKDCIRRWQQASCGSCPLCRVPWQPASRHVAPGECLPASQKLQRTSSGFGMSYLNLHVAS